MNTAFRLLPALVSLAALGCYGDKVFVEDGAGGQPPTSTSTNGGGPTIGGNGNGGASGGSAPGGEAPGGAGGEAPTGCSSPTECPNPASECVDRTCVDTVCGEMDKPLGTACSIGRCRSGTCVECLDQGDCTGSEICDLGTNTCAPPVCSNGNQDPGETDIDCGGAMCPACQNMDSCVGGGDCVSGFCNSSFVCSPCMVDSNCDAATQFCSTGVCTPKLGNGSGCLGNGQCASAACVDTSIGNVCCNTACTGTCMSCALADTGQPNGTCSNVSPNTDPQSECPTQPCRTGTCGTAGCGVSTPGTSCDDATFCNGTDTCTATGTCGHSGNPCPTEPIPDFNCSESCNEAQDNCTSPDPAGTPCTDGFFCTGSSDTCNGTGTCVGGANPCNGVLCTDACNEGADLCNALQAAGTSCNANMNLVIGMCSTSGACLND